MSERAAGTTPPVQGDRRFVAVSRYPYCAASFSQPMTLDQAIEEATDQAAPTRKVAVYELVRVKS